MKNVVLSVAALLFVAAPTFAQPQPQQPQQLQQPQQPRDPTEVPMPAEWLLGQLDQRAKEITQVLVVHAVLKNKLVEKDKEIADLKNKLVEKDKEIADLKNEPKK